jgi:hypothetical protein
VGSTQVTKKLEGTFEGMKQLEQSLKVDL